MAGNSGGALSACPHVTTVGDFTKEDIARKQEQWRCESCGASGPSLWACLYRDCLYVGCGEAFKDHSTLHFQSCCEHSVTLNLSTLRVWCYLCESEVFLENNRPPLLGASPRSNRTLPQGTAHASAGAARVPQGASSPAQDPDSDDEADQENGLKPRGLTGLQNLGNTCYMNAALQALSNCPQLTNFFLDCGSLVPSSKKPGLSKSYMRLVREMWHKRRPSYVVPSGIAYGIKLVCPVFRGYSQQDAQEFLRCFLDQLHEELKEPSGPTPGVGRPRSPPVATTDSSPSEDEGDEEEEDFETCDSGLSSEKSSCGEEGASDLRLLASSHDHLAKDGLGRLAPVEEKAGGDWPQEPHDHSSGAKQGPAAVAPRPRRGRRGASHRLRSVVSDVFDGRILSSVQCLTCDTVSTTRETFQDLSLPIPGRDHLAVLHAAAAAGGQGGGSPHGTSRGPPIDPAASQSWLSWLLTRMFSWVFGWLWGPGVGLQDCLAAFFSADELKGDNMYSCEKCRKLRNGIKFSRVLQLPEVLCIHLKRFRHEVMFSSKIGSYVSFPLDGLDMSPFLHRECPRTSTIYDLMAVICHHGTAGSGHYTTYALNHLNDQWYEFDDQYVTSVEPQVVQNCEAYVLFYRKSSEEMVNRRNRTFELMERSRNEPGLLSFYISKQWVNRFNTFADPGPIDNGDFLCVHGGVQPAKASFAEDLCMQLSQSVWEYLHDSFGGGSACTHLYTCPTCTSEREALESRRKLELETFVALNREFQQSQESPGEVYAVSMAWFKQWEAFVRGKETDAPGPIDNWCICGVTAKSPSTAQTLQQSLRAGSDYGSLSEPMWRFLQGSYGGGPEVPLQQAQPVVQAAVRPTYPTRPPASPSQALGPAAAKRPCMEEPKEESQ